MAHIEVSEKIVKEFERLKKTLQELSPGQNITDDQIMDAMVQGFFDSLAYMKKQAEEAHHGHHHHHGDHECCGSGKCEDD
jgi:hypothetical protein